MSSADVQAPPAAGSFFSRTNGEPVAASKAEEVSAFDAVMPENQISRGVSDELTNCSRTVLFSKVVCQLMGQGLR